MSEEPSQHQVNGAPAPNVETALQQLETWLEQIVAVMIHGTLQACAGARPDILLPVLCRVIGRYISRNYRGETEHVAKIRMQCRAAFRDGISSAPAQPMPQFNPGHRPPAS